MPESSNPRLFGLIGHPVKHSLSSYMHNAAFKKIGLNAHYCLFDIEDSELEDFLLKPDKIFKDTEGNKIAAGKIGGFNVTIPHKVRAKEILENNFSSQTDLANNYSNLVGATNTVKRTASGFSWYNTDAPGFIQSLEEDLDFKAESEFSVLIIGCGGAGRAVISGLSSAYENTNKTIYIYEINASAKDQANKFYDKFPQVKKDLKFINKSDFSDTIKKCKLLVNASPLGMHAGDGSIVSKEQLSKDISVYDLVYNRQTQLISDAKACGCRASGGLNMLLFQGVKALSHWLGQDIDSEVVATMREVLIKKTKEL